MSTPVDSLSPDDAAIVLARELRKTGLALAHLAIRRRVPLPPHEGRYDLLLEGDVVRDGRSERWLVLLRHRPSALGASAVAAMVAELRDSGLRHGCLVGTAGAEPGALAAAEAAGIALIALADGAVAWRESAWGTGAPPVWYPEVVAQRFTRDAAGLMRSAPLGAGHADRLLAAVRPAPSDAADVPGRSPDDAPTRLR